MRYHFYKFRSLFPIYLQLLYHKYRLRPIKPTIILLKWFYQSRKVSGHVYVYVTGLAFGPVSTIFDWILELFWYFLFSILLQHYQMHILLK